MINKPITHVLPDPQFCRAAELTAAFADCLVEKPLRCPYAMPWGYTYLCGHPERSSIVAKTKQLREQQRS